MKVSIAWLKELTKLNTSIEGLAQQLNSKIQGGVKEVTDQYIELDLKGYNRADLLSLRGVAYEVAAITDSEVTFREPQEKDYPWNQKTLPQALVKVEALEHCPFYCIAKIEGLKVEKSPEQWVKKLGESGMRSVNNVADVTNLVMLEYGQPTHAFDAAKIQDETLIVRAANTGEEILTLDNKKRVLEPTDLVIADPQKAVGLAGVMGGKNSEISDSTTAILLEAAIFDPVSIRETAARLNLPSEASKRFQHGLTKKRLFQAVDAAVKMYQGLGGKLTAITVVDNLEEKEITIPLSQEKLNSLIGLEIDPQFAQSALGKLHFQVLTSSNQVWEVTPPYWRLDIKIEADLIEEVARMYGYENIPSKELQGQLPEKIDQSLFETISKIKQALVDAGLDEIQTYSFYSTKVLKIFEIPEEKLIKIANPMSSETEYLRVKLAPNLVEKIVENLKYSSEVSIFEVGKIYLPTDSGPEEKYVLSVALTSNTSNPLAEIYARWQLAAKALGLEIKAEETEKDEREKLVFHPTRFLKIVNQGKDIGRMGEIHPRIINRFGIEKRVAILEIDLSQL
ncbi:MAG: phenylalanine--tRNA ligase subunit beta [Patescibacteria group bacterium]|nr:phenylalanine--tRNA ligase subunit beta [Patescibacteria group bacterium]